MGAIGRVGGPVVAGRRGGGGRLAQRARLGERAPCEDHVPGLLHVVHREHVPASVLKLVRHRASGLGGLLVRWERWQAVHLMEAVERLHGVRVRAQRLVQLLQQLELRRALLEPQGHRGRMDRFVA